MTVIDQHHEAALQATSRVTNPIDRGEADFSGASHSEDGAKHFEMRRQPIVRKRTLTRTKLPVPFFDVDFAQAFGAHDDLVNRERVEELVREDDAGHRGWQIAAPSGAAHCVLS